MFDNADCDLGDGADARRQLRLWCGSSEEFGVTDEQCFVWIAYRGKRFVELARASRVVDMFNGLRTGGYGTVSLSDLDSALVSDTQPQGLTNITLEELQSDVSELFRYHADRYLQCCM